MNVFAPLALAVLLPISPGLAQTDPPAADGAAATTTAPDSVWTAGAVVVALRDGPERALAWEVAIPAPVDDVWRAWTVSEELITWAAPGGGYVEPREGGRWEAWFCAECPPGQRGSDVNRILEIVPGERLVIEAGVPRQFPKVREEKTRFELTLRPVGEHHTLLRGIQTGWKDGEEWDLAFDYLADANATWLGWLHRRFTRGPIDWDAMRGE